MDVDLINKKNNNKENPNNGCIYNKDNYFCIDANHIEESRNNECEKHCVDNGFSTDVMSKHAQNKTDNFEKNSQTAEKAPTNECYNKQTINFDHNNATKDSSSHTELSYNSENKTVSSENHKVADSVSMITLGSNNPLFMQPKSLHGQAIYSDQSLPQFLEDSLNEKLSKIVLGTNDNEQTIDFVDYQNEEHLPDLTALIAKDLSEPYSIYTYRYFLHNWPSLSFLAYCNQLCVGSIVCKLDHHGKNIRRGYIAMLVVHNDYRRHKIGSKLVQKAIRRMIKQGCDEVVLETEVTNRAALNLYENLGFVRDKRLLRYYLNGVDAWRLKLWLCEV